MYLYFLVVGGLVAVVVGVAGGLVYYFRPSSGTHANPNGAACTVKTLQQDVERSRGGSIGATFVSPRERAFASAVELHRMKGALDDLRDLPDEGGQPALVRRYVRFRGEQSGNPQTGVAFTKAA